MAVRMSSVQAELPEDIIKKEAESHKAWLKSYVAGAGHAVARAQLLRTHVDRLRATTAACRKLHRCCALWRVAASRP